MSASSPARSITASGVTATPLGRGRSRGSDRRLRRGHPRDRQTERRARDVVQAGAVEEGDRVRVPAVLAADAELDVRAPLASAPDGELDEPTDAGHVDRLERRAVEDVLLDVG